MPARAELFTQLRNLTKSWNDYDLIPTAEQHECRRIGEELNKLGGMKLMRKAYYDAKAHNRSAMAVQAYWDGVGDWRW